MLLPSHCVAPGNLYYTRSLQTQKTSKQLVLCIYMHIKHTSRVLAHRRELYDFIRSTKETAPPGGLTE